ncbi:MAG: DNA cytosine methyltransferase [Thermoplasmatota archaeon]
MLVGYRILDLFAGAGGASVGFRRANCRPVGAVELDLVAASTFAANLGVVPLVADLRCVDAQNILEFYGLGRADIDAIIGCPPCQGFTRMRNGSGRRDPRNALVSVFLQIIRDIRPRFVAFENVPGILEPRHRRRFDLMVAALRRIGYHVTQGVLEAADYGVPQFRRRLVVVADRDCVPVLPTPTHAEVPRRGETRKHRTVRDAIADLPRLRAGEASSIPNHEARSHSQEVVRLISRIPHDGGSRTDLPRRYWLACHQEHEGHYDVYGRMRWDSPSPTITSGCTNPSRGRFTHPSQDRAITAREAARLQTFPNNFRFLGGREEIQTQIGNAFPPLLAERVAEALLP